MIWWGLEDPILLMVVVSLILFFAQYSYPSLQEKRLNITKKFVAITTNVVVIGVIATIKKLMQAVVINSMIIG